MSNSQQQHRTDMVLLEQLAEQLANSQLTAAAVSGLYFNTGRQVILSALNCFEPDGCGTAAVPRRCRSNTDEHVSDDSNNKENKKKNNNKKD